MYSDTVLSIFIYLINSLLGGWYIQKILRPKYKKEIVVIGCMILYFVVQYVTSEMFGSVYPLNVAGNMIISFFTFFILGSLFFHGNLTIKLFVSFSFVAGVEIVKFISSALSFVLIGFVTKISLWVTNGIIEQSTEIINVSTTIVLIVCILIQSIILYLYLLIIVRQRVECESNYSLHESLFLILPSFTVLCTAILLRMVVISIENGISILIYDKITATRFWIPFINLLLLGIVLSSVYLFQKMLQRNEEEKKRLLLENQVIQIQQEIVELQDIYSDMRSLRHDLRGHLANISALVKENSTNSYVLPEYIEKMEETIERLDFPHQTGNPITDVIIWRKIQEAEKKGVSLQIDFRFPNGQKIDAYDIGIILNNTLTNAIEACSVSKNGIVLRSYMKGNLFFIEVENDFDGEIIWNEKTGLPISSKENQNAHGVGLSSVRRCAQKYNGDIDINISNINDKKIFQLTVMMCGKNFTPENQ